MPEGMVKDAGTQRVLRPVCLPPQALFRRQSCEKCLLAESILAARMRAVYRGETILSIVSHSPSYDGLFTLEIVSCLGACCLSPVVMVNDTVHAAMTPEKAKALVEQLRAGG